MEARSLIKYKFRDFPGGPVVMNMPCIAGDKRLIPAQGTKVPYVTEATFFFFFLGSGVKVVLCMITGLSAKI